MALFENLLAAKIELAKAVDAVRKSPEASAAVPPELLAALLKDGVSAEEHQQVLQILNDVSHGSGTWGKKELTRLLTEVENVVGQQNAAKTTAALKKLITDGLR